MTILFVGSSPDELGGVTTAYTGTNGRDADFTPVGCQISYPDTGAGFGINFADATGDVWMHWLMYTSAQWGGDLNDDGRWVDFYNDDTLLFRIDVNNGGFFLQAGDGTSSNEITMGKATEYTVDLKFTKSGSSHTCELRFGGVLQATSTYTNAAGPVNRVAFRHEDMSFDEPSDTGTAFYSEFIVTDGEPTTGWRLATLDPNTDGTHTAWDGGVAGIADLGDGQSISSDTDEAKQSWDLTAYGGPATASGVRAVVTSFNASVGVGGPDEIVPFCRSGGTDYEATAFTPDGSQYLYVLDNDPNGDTTWDTADLSGIEIGVKANVGA